MSLTKVSYAMITGAPFNVADYGAVGDGITDDYAALQSAVNAAAAVNGLVVFDAKNYKISQPITISGTFRSVKLQGVGTGDAITSSSAGTTIVTNGTYNAIVATFNTYANENILIDGICFYNVAQDQTNGGAAIKIVRGASNTRYISGFEFTNIGINGFGSAFDFQGMNTVNADNNFIGRTTLQNVSVTNTGIFFYYANCSLNLLSLYNVDILDCKYGGFRGARDGDVGTGNGKGGILITSLFKCHFEGVGGGLFRTNTDPTLDSLGNTLRNSISLYDFTHESCGATVDPVAGEPFVLGLNNDLFFFGKVPYGAAYGEVSVPYLDATSTASSTSPVILQMTGGQSLSADKINAPILYRTIANGANATLTVTVNESTAYALQSTLLLSGGQAGIVESLHNGIVGSAPTRTAIAGTPAAGIALTWGTVAGSDAIQLQIANTTGFAITAKLLVTNVSGATILQKSEI